MFLVNGGGGGQTGIIDSLSPSKFTKIRKLNLQYEFLDKVNEIFREIPTKFYDCHFEKRRIW